MKILARIFLVITLFTVGIFAQHDHHSSNGSESEISKNTELLDEFGQLGHCDQTGRFDTFFAELSRRTDTRGYVMIYQSVEALPSNYGEPFMERVFLNHLAFRNFDADRVVVIKGGFQSEDRTQLWIVPLGAEPPTPQDTLNPPVIPTSETFLFDRDYFYSEEIGDSLAQFELPSVKAKRAEEEALWAIEIASESLPEEDIETSTTSEQAAETDAPVEPEDEYVDSRTPEEIEAERFSWVSDKFAAQLAKRADSAGVIMLYADDETYDVAQLKSFIEQGRKRLAESAGINAARISIEFGGYRPIPVLEYFLVPAEGKAPVATPEERSVEEPEATEN